eukprot:TRINITY_DN3521_c0_g1_i1.p1 TRINITY_DN3521_c0_g1~~TRINITY_DN3521_c0_g1_i1.p1  ORF type:complete len:731 (+),score=124.83 TRINITY_DN3521_c0_g1_i1:3-2195(+)
MIYDRGGLFLCLYLGLFFSLKSVASIQEECPDVSSFTSISCNSSQVLCFKGYSEKTQCSLGSFCYDKKGPCDDHCPCMDRDLTCETSPGFNVDPYDNCPPPPTCIYKETINSRGNVCPSFCPAQCGEGFRICPPVLDSRGCLQPELCVQSLQSCPQSLYDSRGCLLRKLKACREGTCPTMYDDTGCPKEAVCGEDVDGKCPVSEFDDLGCAVLDPLICAEDEVRCSKGFDGNDCLIGFICQKKFTGDNCINFCPTNCDPENNMLCSQGIGINGCPLPDICIPQRTSALFLGQKIINCTNHCRPPCDLSSNKLCPPVFDSNGCPEAETCVPRERKCRESKYDPEGCLIPQPQACNENTDMLCIGGTDQNGCPLQNTCIPRRIGNCLQSCPTKCGPDSIQCQNGVDESGCNRPDTCVPKQLPGYDNCPGICPTVCGRDQVKCVVSKKPQVLLGALFVQTKNCIQKEFCMDIMDKSTNCSNFCPVTCSEESEQLCESMDLESGCSLMSACVPKHTRGGRGNICTEHCPLDCPKGERPCPGSIGEDSCRGPPTCMSKEARCPEGERDTLGCVIVEEVNEEECKESDGRVCPGVFDERGCRGAPSCVMKDDPCPDSMFDAHGCSVLEPMTCDWSSEMLCSTPLDEKQCPTPGKCTKIHEGHCGVFCDPVCDPASEQLCDGGLNVFQCPEARFCYYKNKPCPKSSTFLSPPYQPYVHRNTLETPGAYFFWNYPLVH